jgi:tetratricopeptide (TPR) repeat protein
LARERLQEGLELAEKLGKPREIAGALNALAQTARASGDLVTAEPLYARVLHIARQSGDIDIIAVSLLNLAMVATGSQSHEAARTMLLEVLKIVDESGLRPAAQGLLEVSAGLAASRSEWEMAVRLFGAAEAQTAATGLTRDPADEAFLAPLIATAKEELGAEVFATASAAGRALGYDAAIAELRRWLDRSPTNAQ